MKKNVKGRSQNKVNILLTIRQAFAIKKAPLPWIKAISAGFCMAVPVLIGLLLGNLQYGLFAGIGGFTYLYMFNEPYAERAKKLFFVMIGISLSVGIGTLLAPYPFPFALMVGLIGAVVTFIFGALKIPGPAAVFFVLTFAMTSTMPIDPSLAPLRGGLILLDGSLAWIVAMSGWFVNPRGPETMAIKRVYSELALLLEAVGTADFSEKRQSTVLRIKEAENMLLSGYISWDKSLQYKKLYTLYEQANLLLSEILDFYATSNEKLSPELGDAIKTLSDAIGKKGKVETRLENGEDELNRRLVKKVAEAEAVINKSNVGESEPIHITKPSLKEIFGGNFDKNSIVFLSAIKYGFILMVAALVAFSFDFNRSYWIPLSCAAVMLGSTILTTFHRSIQRTVGTIIGILIASILLSVHPDGYLIVVIILILSFMTELFIVRNYAIAVIFITPNAIFMAENTTQIHNVSYFATARITDIFIGCAIGLIGTFMIGRRSASSRLSHLVAKTIRSQIQFIVLLFSKQQTARVIENSSEKRKMHINLTNLSIVYTTALGEIPNDRRALEFLWPVIFSVEQLGYMLENASKRSDRPILKDGDLAQLLLVFEMMARAAKQKESSNTKYVPEINGFPQIQREIVDLQGALQIGEKK